MSSAENDEGLHRFLLMLQCVQIHNASGDTEGEQRALAAAKRVAERYGLPFDPPCWKARA